MATLGAVQLDIVINGKSITITKDHAVSLRVTRLIGDAADQFTLEAYDETAYKLESALMDDRLASISVRYSVSTKNNKNSVLFAGTCYNYELTFVGRATMLTITGILASSTGIENGYWFDTRAVEWVGGLNYYTDASGNKVIWGIDGKSQDQYANFKENLDVCAFLDYPIIKDENGNETVSSVPVAYYNPARVFRRIIHAYNGDKLGSTSTTTTTVHSGSPMTFVANTNIKNNDVTKKIWNYLTGTNKYNPYIAAGIMGNMMRESSMNPSADNGTHYGLCQWSKTIFPQMNGASLDRQLAFIDSWLKERLRIAINNGFILYKKRSSALTYPRSLDAFFKLTDVKTIAYIFNDEVEVSEDVGANRNLRANYANAYLLLYTNNTPTTTTTTTTTTEYTTTVEGWGTGGNNGFILGEVAETKWIADMPVLQQANETAAQYITNVLCKYAITDTENTEYKDEIAGFQYVIRDGKHCFIPLDYGKDVNKSNTIDISYGMQGSEVISFTVAKVGVLAMMGNNVTADQVADATSTDGLYGEAIRQGGENVYGVQSNVAETEDNSEYLNWYAGISNKSFKGVRVSSSSSDTALSSNVASFWNTLENYTFSAELTVWSDGSNKYVPGKYVDIIIRGADGLKHYASGVYYIVKVDDSISVDGYTQTLKLLKNVGDKSKFVSTSTGEDNTSVVENPVLHDRDGNVISSISTVPKSTTDTQISTSGGYAALPRYYMNGSGGSSAFGSRFRRW